MTDVLPDGRTSAAAMQYPEQSILAWTLASCGMVLVLMAPALWNGFPIIFSDTGGYLTRPIEGVLALGRSALYGLFLYAGVPLAFWPNALVQCAVIAWLIVLTLRTNGLGGRPWLALGIVAALSVGTSLPWFAGQLMPDILFPAAALALYLLAFRHGQLAGWERIALVAVIMAAIASHMAAAGMCVGIALALWLLTRVTWLDLPRPRLSLAAAAVAAGVALCPVSNFAITGNFAFTPGGPSFLFGRLLEDGIVARYLEERCPDPALKLCAMRADLPTDADGWLWGDNTFNRLGYQAWEPEEKEIIADTLQRYPLTQAAAAVIDTLRQFASFKTELSLTDNAPTLGTLADRTPQLMDQVTRARQQNDQIGVTLLNYVHVPVAALAIAALFVALVRQRRWRIAPETAALCLTVLLALAANAAVCGIFSHPVDRYQSRLVLLAPLAVAVLIARRERA